MVCPARCDFFAGLEKGWVASKYSMCSGVLLAYGIFSISAFLDINYTFVNRFLKHSGFSLLKRRRRGGLGHRLASGKDAIIDDVEAAADADGDGNGVAAEANSGDAPDGADVSPGRSLPMAPPTRM